MISTNYYVNQPESKTYATQPNWSADECPENLFECNVIDMGDLSDYEYVESSENNDNTGGFFENMKKWFS